MRMALLLLSLLISLQSMQAITLNYVLQEWSSNMPINAYFIQGICSYNYTLSKDDITIALYDQHPWQFNITSLSLNVLPAWNMTVGSKPNGFTTLRNKIYFTDNYHPLEFDVNNFYVYDIVTNELIKQGNLTPKPQPYRIECYTTNYKQYIYIIGGWGKINGKAGDIASTYIFNVDKNEWADGPNLNVGRYSAACIYNTDDDILYVFGGSSKINSIEIYDTLNSNRYVLLTGVTLTPTDYGIQAFMPDKSSSIFIVGGTNGFCNKYEIHNQIIHNCPGIGMPSSGSSGVIVQTKEFIRYYLFKGEYGGFVDRIYKYASLLPPPNCCLWFSGSITFTGERVPIIMEAGYNLNNKTFNALLVCDKLNINYTMYYYNTTTCIVCNNSNHTQCFNCSFGILPTYSLPLSHPHNITCDNIIADNNDLNMTIMDDLNVTYFQQYFDFDIFSDGTVKFIVNDMYVLNYNITYYF
eukprot:86250_1